MLERGLWSSRLFMIVAVVMTLLFAVGALVLATLDAAYLVELITRYAGQRSLDVAACDLARTDAITTIVKALDDLLIAALLLIAAFGIYELFVNRLDPADETPATARLLRVRDLDDLKERVAKLVLVLAVEFFQQALRLPIETPLELTYLGIGVMLVSAALYLSGRHGHG